MKSTENKAKVLGNSISIIMAILAILNYLDMMASNVHSRSQELATLESIGMTSKQAKKMLGMEGISYAVISIIASLAAGIYSSYFLEHYKDIPYLIATVRMDNIPSCKVAENAGFLLEETKLYQDIYDKEPYKYNFYIKK